MILVTEWRFCCPRRAAEWYRFQCDVAGMFSGRSRVVFLERTSTVQLYLSAVEVLV